jgi:hypothetical protein
LSASVGSIPRRFSSCRITRISERETQTSAGICNEPFTSPGVHRAASLIDEKRLASYFGIVPRVANSNQTEALGRIHKRGTKLGRTALVQSALIAARYSPYLRSFYERVKARRGAGKAIIARDVLFLGSVDGTAEANFSGDSKAPGLGKPAKPNGHTM